MQHLFDFRAKRELCASAEMAKIQMPADDELRQLKFRIAEARKLTDSTTDLPLKRSVLNHISELEARIAKLEAPALPAAAAIPSEEPPIGPELAAALKMPPPEADEQSGNSEESDTPTSPAPASTA
jgi:hypothetical protein